MSSGLASAIWRSSANLQLSAMQGNDKLTNCVLGSAKAVVRSIGDLILFDKTPAVLRPPAHLRLV